MAKEKNTTGIEELIATTMFESTGFHALHVGVVIFLSSSPKENGVKSP